MQSSRAAMAHDCRIGLNQGQGGAARPRRSLRASSLRGPAPPATKSSCKPGRRPRETGWHPSGSAGPPRRTAPAWARAAGVRDSCRVILMNSWRMSCRYGADAAGRGRARAAQRGTRRRPRQDRPHFGGAKNPGRDALLSAPPAAEVRVLASDRYCHGRSDWPCLTCDTLAHCANTLGIGL
jgi:hypothetical protein